MTNRTAVPLFNRIKFRPKFFSLSNYVALTLLTLFFLLAIVAPFLPDYESYREIYDTGGGYLDFFGRDLGFVLLTQVASHFLDYEQFRIFILILIAALMFYSMQKVQSILKHKFNLIFVLALMPIMVLKFGIQVREGLALCLWLTMLFFGIKKPNKFIFFAVAFLSVSIHLGVTPLWALLAISLYFERYSRIALTLSFSLYATFIYMVSDVSRLKEEAFAGISIETVSPEFSQLIYWAIFPIIMVFSMTRGYLKISNDYEYPKFVHSLKFILQSAIIGLMAGLFLQIVFNGIAFMLKGVIADILRIEALILMLLSMYLALCEKKKPSVIISLFLIVDTVRIILAAL